MSPIGTSRTSEDVRLESAKWATADIPAGIILRRSSDVKGASCPLADDAEGQARHAAFTQALGQLGWSEGRDRKSTRPSHLGISYAVFCLKKKRKRMKSSQ